MKKREKSEIPTDEQVEEWITSGIAEATDGCPVEPDGECEHGGGGLSNSDTFNNFSRNKIKKIRRTKTNDKSTLFYRIPAF